MIVVVAVVLVGQALEEVDEAHEDELDEDLIGYCSDKYWMSELGD